MIFSKLRKAKEGKSASNPKKAASSSKKAASVSKRATSSSKKAASFKSEYRISDHKRAIAAAEKSFELVFPSARVERAPLKPLHSIEAPRFVRGGDGVYSCAQQSDTGSARIFLAGDIMCRAEQQEEAFERNGVFDFSDSFTLVRELLRDADFVSGNLETVLSESAEYTCDRERTVDGKNRNAPSTFLDAIRECGFDCLVTANNHCFDAGVRGIFETLCHLDQYGFIHTGTFFGAKDRAARPFELIRVNGLTLAVLSYTYRYSGWKNSITQKGRKSLLNVFGREKMEADVAAAKEAGAEFVFCYIHWGKEFTHEVREKQLERAHDLAEAGVDFIVGSHPHALQPFDYVERSDGARIPVIYSLGNFISSMEREISKDTVVFDVDLERGDDGKVRATSISYIPCYTSTEYDGKPYVVVPLRGSEAESCAEFAAARQRISDVMGEQIGESQA